MGFQDFGGAQVTALTQDEMNAEAERILKRIDAECPSADSLPPDITPNARQFVERKLGVVRVKGHLRVTVKELWWLRSINEKI
jgi:hypothetical protein